MTTTMIISRILLVVAIWIIGVIIDFVSRDPENEGPQHLMYVHTKPILRWWVFTLDLGFTPWIIYYDGVRTIQRITLDG